MEPGPVITEFERKVYENGVKTDLSKADQVTSDMFTNIYLKNYGQIFETLGQTPEDIAEVAYSSVGVKSNNLLQVKLINSIKVPITVCVVVVSAYFKNHHNG